MELRQYIVILRRRKWSIIAAAIVVTLLAAAYSFVATPIYRSATTVRVATIGGGIAGQYPNIGYSERLMNTYSQMVTGNTTMAEIRSRLALAERPSISVEVLPNTELLRISVEAENPQVAQDVAMAAAELLNESSRALFVGSGQTTLDILSQQLAQAEGDLADVQSDYEALLEAEGIDPSQLSAASQAVELRQRTYASLLEQYEKIRLNEAFVENAVSVVEPAWLPDAPAKPRTKLNLVLGVLVGLMAGVGLALLLDNLDTRLYTTGQIEAVTQMPITGQIPTAGRKLGVVGLNGDAGQQSQAEAFRRLRINLLSVVPEGQPYVILVTSGDEGEGKSTVAANLAISMANSGRSITLVDCDMHKPTMHKLFNLTNDHGLINYLTNQVDANALLQPTDLATLQVIPSGSGMRSADGMDIPTELTPVPLVERLRQGSELLGSSRMRSLITELRTQFDVVVLDTPALSTITDAAMLAPQADHVILVAAQAKAERETVRAACQQLGVVNVRSMSLVVNRTSNG